MRCSQANPRPGPEHNMHQLHRRFTDEQVREPLRVVARGCLSDPRRNRCRSPARHDTLSCSRNAGKARRFSSLGRRGHTMPVVRDRETGNETGWGVRDRWSWKRACPSLVTITPRRGIASTGDVSRPVGSPSASTPRFLSPPVIPLSIDGYDPMLLSAGFFTKESCGPIFRSPRP